MNAHINKKPGTPENEVENSSILATEVINYIDSRRRWFRAFDFLTNLFIANARSQTQNMSETELSIFKLQHTINYLNCANIQEQSKYISEKLFV